MTTLTLEHHTSFSATGSALASAVTELTAARIHRDNAVASPLVHCPDGVLGRAVRAAAGRRVTRAEALVATARMRHAGTRDGRVELWEQADWFEVCALQTTTAAERLALIRQSYEIRDCVTRGEVLSAGMAG